MARKRFNFWLDDKRSEDWSINSLITDLKAKGQFTQAIRQGLRLWVDLKAGNTAVLIELFPQFKDKLHPPTSTPTSGAGGSDLAKEIAAQIILQGGTPGYLMQSALPTPVTAQPLKAQAVKASAKVSIEDINSNMLSMFD
jgi:hypothetical protein